MGGNNFGNSKINNSKINSSNISSFPFDKNDQFPSPGDVDNPYA